MEYFRRYLIYIRKLDNTEMRPHFIIRMIITTLVSLILGVIADKILPYNFLYNMIRGILATITGVASASYTLVVSDRIKLDKYRVDNNYQPFRKRLSYRQRTNISILLGSILVIFILLSNKENLVFTLKTSIAIFIGILLTAFSRKDRNEFLKDIYDIPDIRDLEFMSKKSKKNKPKSHDKTKNNKKSKKSKMV